MKLKLTLVLSILSATRVGAQTPTFRGECRVTVVEYLCIEDVLGEQCDHTRLTCDDSEGVIHDVLGPSSKEIMEMVDAGIIQSTVSVFNPNDEEAVSFDGENVIIDMSNGFSLENLSITQDNYLAMSPKKGDIVINEVADQGSSGTCDEKSWVELYNKGTINIDLIGMSLYRQAYGRKKLTFGSTVMMAGEYLLICNPNPRVGSGPPPPPGFTRQILSDTEGKEVSSTGYFRHNFGDVTWSLLADGTYADGAATPGSINRCQEKPLDKFYLSIKQFRTCQWLSNLKSVTKKHIICKRKVDWMNKIGPAEVVCQETCKTCAICYQQDRSRFYYKTKIGRPKYSTCRKLEKKEKKEAICKSIVFDETYGIPCALFACPQTCLLKDDVDGQKLC